MTAPRETEILHAVRAALVATGRVTIWRCNGGVDVDRGVRYGLGVGAADLIGLLVPSGRFLGVEIKTPVGRLSMEQKLWGETVRRGGGVYIVARSAADALEQLAEVA